MARMEAKVFPLLARTDDVEDAELVGRFRAGDEHALEVLYRRHAPQMLALATRLTGQAAEGDDAVHDAFLRAIRQLDQLRDPSLFDRWLRRIVVNECRERLRKRRRWLIFPRGESPDELFEAMAGRTGKQEHAAELRRIGGLLGHVATDDRIAWSLRFMEGYSLEEGAIAAGCSLATFKRRLSRATKRLGALTMEAAI